MDNTLIMDVSGAWVRKSEASSADQMNALADEKERQFVAKYLGDAIDPIGTEAATDCDMRSQICHSGKPVSTLDDEALARPYHLRILLF